MNAVLIAAVLIVAAITLLWAQLRPQRAETAYGWLEGGRKVGAAVFLIIFSATALQSGRWYLVLAALVAISAATLYVAVERPHRRVVQ